MPLLSLRAIACHLALLATAAVGLAAEPARLDLFVAGQHGYHTFRIPAIIATPQGTVLAFCEGRKQGRGDAGNIDLVLRRSADGGRTWGDLQVVWDDGPNTIGNPCPVVDRATGRIWLPLNRNLGSDHEGAIKSGESKGVREIWITHSDDEGRTWAKPRNISGQGRRENWGWLACGPGGGIQLASGRLLIPCNHSVAPGSPYFAHVLYSDDHGQSWHIGENVGPNTNECQAVELSDGRVMMNMRSYAGKNRRAVAVSDDGGQTWSKPKLDAALIEPVCQASLIRYVLPGRNGKQVLLFSNPASRSREKMTVRLSYDEGRTWPVARLLDDGSAAYSSLVALPNGDIGCLYERDNYQKITLARFSLAWLAGEE